MLNVSWKSWLLRLSVTLATVVILLASLAFVTELAHAHGAQRPHLTQQHSVTQKLAQARPLATGPSPMISYGGKVETSPAVYLIFWGSDWTNHTKLDTYGFTNTQAATYIYTFFGDVGGSDWLNTLTQYCQGVGINSTSCAGQPASNRVGNPRNLLKGIWFDPSNPPTSMGDGEVQGEVGNAFAHFNSDSTAMYFVFTPTGVKWSTPPWAGSACAWHAYRDILGAANPIPYAYIGYDGDYYNSNGSPGCYAQYVNDPRLGIGAANPQNGNGEFDAFSINGGHELAEAMTDPIASFLPPNPLDGLPGWADTSLQEVGDKCDANQSYTHPYGNMFFLGQLFAVQGLWSNQTANCVLGTPQNGTVFTGNPSPVSYNNMTPTAFARGTEGAIYQTYWNGSAWQSMFDLGGNFASDPVTTMYGSDLYVFARGNDNALYEMYWDGQTWNGWYSLGGGMVGNPSVVLFNGDLQVFVRGITSNALYQKVYDGATWTNWTYLGGGLTSNPVPVDYNGILNVFVRGTDNALYDNYYDPRVNTWSGWISLGGGLNDNPAPIDYGGILNVFVHGTNGALYDNYYDPKVNHWSGWISLGGGVTWSPAPVDYNGILNVFVRGTNGALYDNFYDPKVNTWSGWQPLGGYLTSIPVPINFNNILNVFVFGSDDALWDQDYNPALNKWSGWYKLGLP